ncbi:hypothetical protein F511_47777 [Dorcoceras hygrometricum]|uniref:Uncharacterized protein n=1 Tax=Dorcoceras hygrometricum TaxID=472368 RepID=A0A2Z6ZWE1_9LAMI|nr:hypothetical protein F511_47777 [Dorcoceras hygrometricum]
MEVEQDDEDQLKQSDVVLQVQQMKKSAKVEATSSWRFSRWFSVDDVISDVISISR